MSVVKRVNDELQIQVQGNAQYSWRSSCVVVMGMEQPNQDESNDEAASKVISNIVKETGISSSQLFEKLILGNGTFKKSIFLLK